MLSLSAHFPQWDRIPVTTHSSSCHALRRFSMKHLSFFPFISSRMACSLTYYCISLLDIPLWFWVGCFNVTSILSSSFFPNKDVFARPSGPGAPLHCLKGRRGKSRPGAAPDADTVPAEAPAPQPSGGQRLSSPDRLPLVPTH